MSYCTIARSLSCARPFAISVSARSLCTCLEREGEQTPTEKICSSGHLWFFSAALRDGPVRNELFFINGVVDGTSGERF